MGGGCPCIVSPGFADLALPCRNADTGLAHLVRISAARRLPTSHSEAKGVDGERSGRPAEVVEVQEKAEGSKNERKQNNSLLLLIRKSFFPEL